MKINKIDLNKSILEQLEEDYPEKAKDWKDYRNLNSALCLISLKINDLIDKVEEKEKEEERNEKKDEILELLDLIMKANSSFEIAQLSHKVAKINY